MFIYTKYLLLSLLKPFLVVSVSLTGVIWLTQSLRYLDMMVEQGIGLLVILSLALKLLPYLLLLVLPLSLFIAVIMCCYSLRTDNEIIILKTAGCHDVQIIRPFLLFGLMVTLMLYCFSLWLSPNMYHSFRIQQLLLRHNYSAISLQDKTFISPIKGLTIYIDEDNGNNQFSGVLVHDARQTHYDVTLVASKALLVYNEYGIPVFELYNGSRQEKTAKDTISMLYFDYYPLCLTDNNKTDLSYSLDARERGVVDLLTARNLSPTMKRKFRAEGHYRLYWPLLAIMLAWIAAKHMISSYNPRHSQSNDIIRLFIKGWLVISSVMIIHILSNKFTFIVFGNYFLLLTYLGCNYWQIRKSYLED